MRELLAIVDALKHFQPQLAGTKFTILTDHKGLTTMLNRTDLYDKVARWKEIIYNFNCTIEYIPGPKNFISDALSRRPHHEKFSNTTDYLQEPLPSTKISLSTLPSPTSPTVERYKNLFQEANPPIIMANANTIYNPEEQYNPESVEDWFHIYPHIPSNTLPREQQHTALHWTGCFLEECKFHEQVKVYNRYWPKEPKKIAPRKCRTCGQQGHNSQYCSRYNKPSNTANPTELPNWVYQPAGPGLDTNRGATEGMDGVSAGPSAPTAPMAPPPSKNLPDEGPGIRTGGGRKKGRKASSRDSELSSLSTISDSIFKDYEHIHKPLDTTPFVTFSGEENTGEPGNTQLIFHLPNTPQSEPSPPPFNATISLCDKGQKCAFCRDTKDTHPASQCTSGRDQNLSRVPPNTPEQQSSDTTRGGQQATQFQQSGSSTTLPAQSPQVSAGGTDPDPATYSSGEEEDPYDPKKEWYPTWGNPESIFADLPEIKPELAELIKAGYLDDPKFFNYYSMGKQVP